MSFITYIIITFTVIGLFYLVKFLNKKAEKNMDETKFKVHQPFAFLLMSIICTILFGALTIYTAIFPDDTMEWWIYLIFSLFTVSGLFMTIYCLSWEINIENENIVFSPFLGFKRNYTINNITKVKLFNNKKIKVFSGEKKLFSVEPTSKGYNILISRLKKEQINFDVELNKLSI